MNDEPSKLLIDPKGRNLANSMKAFKSLTVGVGKGRDEDHEIDQLRYLAQIENQVRRRLQDILGAAGLSSDGVAKEVLYWLPAEFVEWYQRLFLRALQLNQEQGKGKANGRKADLGKALVDEKEYKGKVIGAGAGGRKGSGGSARNGGGAWVVRDEEALKLLGEVNKELVMMPYDQFQGRIKFVKQVGVIVDRVMEGKRKGEGRKRRVCGDCAKLMREEWGRCPFHE